MPVISNKKITEKIKMKPPYKSHLPATFEERDENRMNSVLMRESPGQKSPPQVTPSIAGGGTSEQPSFDDASSLGESRRPLLGMGAGGDSGTGQNRLQTHGGAEKKYKCRMKKTSPV